MRLIDGDALAMHMADWQLSACSDQYDTIEEAIDAVTSAPTIDAEPVIRCKDCKWWTKQEKSIQGRCALNGTYSTGGWYCANGRRDDEID